MALLGLDTSGFNAFFFQLLSSFLFWGILAFAFVVVTIGILYFRKKRKLQFPTHILTDLGGGKLGIDTKKKSGWFKHKTALFGLYDYGGEECLKTADGRVILDASSEDFQDINGRRGIIVIRSSQDPRILVPVSKMKVSNGNLLTDIAPATYREASVSIIKQAERETADKMEKIVQWVIFGGVIIFALIGVILITQMVKNGQAEAGKVLLEAGRITKDNIETICKGYIANSVPGSAP